MFSSYLPFQINYDEWKVSDDFTEGWASSSFDDSQWTSMKASEIGKRDSVSTFIRRSFSIPSLDDYSVLNVRVRYGAGLVAYFNNRMVARYNMPSTFDATTTATSVHDTSSFSVFHVLLSIDGAVESSNTMAFELHRHASPDIERTSCVRRDRVYSAWTVARDCRRHVQRDGNGARGVGSRAD